MEESGPDGRVTARSRRPPRATGRAQVLSREEILAAAIAIADRGGLERLSMRHLADELHVSAMSLYAHVADKDEILDSIIERRLRESGLPERSSDWLGWTAEVADRLRKLLVDNPALLDRYCRRPVGVPAALDRMEASIAVLRRTGFSGPDAINTFAAVHTYTIGFAALESSRRGTALQESSDRSSRTRATPLQERSAGYWPAYFATLDPRRFPHLVELCPDLASFTSAAQFKVGIETLLAGLCARFVALTVPAAVRSDDR